jgi:transcriptional regulator with XRE-family HTH domain
MIRAERAARKLSQAALAARFGVRPQTIGAWEKGAAPPQPRFFDRLAEFLNLSSADDVRKLAHGEALDTDAPASYGMAPTASEDVARELEIRLNVSRRIAEGPLSAEEVALIRDLLSPLVWHRSAEDVE